MIKRLLISEKEENKVLYSQSVFYHQISDLLINFNLLDSENCV